MLHISRATHWRFSSIFGNDFEVPKIVKILLVEDDVRFLDELASLLRDWGYDVDEALNPSAALQLLERGSYGIIITDESFDGTKIKGSRFIVENIHLMRNVKIILLTGNVLIFEYPGLSKHDINFLDKSDSILIEELRRILNS